PTDRQAEGLANALHGRELDSHPARSEARRLRAAGPDGGPKRPCPARAADADGDGEECGPVQGDQGHRVKRAVSHVRMESPRSVQAYLDNIRAKTGKTPEQFKALAEKAGVYRPDMKAIALIAWLKKEFDLGHGHSMAIWAVFKGKGWVT